MGQIIARQAKTQPGIKVSMLCSLYLAISRRRFNFSMTYTLVDLLTYLSKDNKYTKLDCEIENQFESSAYYYPISAAGIRILVNKREGLREGFSSTY